MAEATVVKANEVTESEEIRAFYCTLAVKQAEIFLYVSRAVSEEDTIKRAVEMTKGLEMIAVPLDERGEKCGVGTVWNPITQRCE